MRFTWDRRKAASNLKKHGVSFPEAATAFDDELGAYYPDALHEDRFVLIGYSKRDRLLYVVHAEVRQDVIRIIGARRATSHESGRTTKTTDPLDGPIDFKRFGPVRRHAFAGAGEPGGPSLLALWEMPQLATGAVRLRRGRPGKGRRQTSTVRSVRLPDTVWKEMERAARARHLNLHQAMRAALLGWIQRAG